MFARVLVFLLAFSFAQTCLSAEPVWRPKASDTCASFAAEIDARHMWPKFSSPKQNYSLLWRDKAIEKLMSDLNKFIDKASPNKREVGDERLALMNLLLYCDKKNALVKLKDITAQAVLDYELGGPVDPVQQLREDAYMAALAWQKATLASCGSDSECARIANSYGSHATSCFTGNQQACMDVERDRKDWELRGTNAPATVVASKDAMMQCLQDALLKTIEGCRQTNCPDESMLYQARLMQQAQCGYSAIETAASIRRAAPQVQAYPTPAYRAPVYQVPQPQYKPEYDSSCMTLCMNGKDSQGQIQCQIPCRNH